MPFVSVAVIAMPCNAPTPSGSLWPPTSVDTRVPTAPTGAGASSFTAGSVSTVSASTGASFTAVTLTVLVSVFESISPSFATKLTVRAAVLGASLEFAYVTARSAVRHSASVAVAPAEVRVSTPVAPS